MDLIIAEKPSVARNIAEALKLTIQHDGFYEGNDYCVTWAFGHLLELWDSKEYDSKMSKWKMEYFPFIPDTFKYKVKTDRRNKTKQQPDSRAANQLDLIASIIEDNGTENVISACDYDREGQIIGDLILEQLKVNKPVYRILLNEWTEKEVLKALKNPIPNEQLLSLRNAGVARMHADWLIGINLTSVATLKYSHEFSQVYNIGRVLLPTLKLVYDRDIEIEKHISSEYHKLKCNFDFNGKDLIATYSETKPADAETTADAKDEKYINKFNTREKLDAIAKVVKGQDAVLSNKEVKSKKEYPPLLFNLSALQGYLTNQYKEFTSDKVLSIAQQLYENKYITYPRTASSFLDESLVFKAKKVLQVVKKGRPYEDEIVFKKYSRVFNSSQVNSHSAIIPTYKIPITLPVLDYIVYTAIVDRFIMQFMPIAEHDETTLTITADAAPDGVFIAKSRVQKVLGFKKVDECPPKETILPMITVDEKGVVLDATVATKKTKPPKHHTEKTLLRAMETCGKKDIENSDDILKGYTIGTPATRADIISRLCSTSYISIQNKKLQTTVKGRALIETLPVKELMDLEYTGRLEKTLTDIEKGLASHDNFLEHIKIFVRSSVENIKTGPSLSADTIAKLCAESSIATNPKPLTTTVKREELGLCPLCQSSVIQGTKGYGCLGFKNGCKFVLWQQDETFKKYNKILTKTAVKKLLKDGSVRINDFKTSKGTKFDAIVSFEISNNTICWKFSRP
ncbi:type IA DNA topoisomerase [Candidatus Epulonipiscium viviparus]|uniref:type IA DNA topoisomerase n=1 Tax=Candidatus Epulonipiscium viviparus TaxID=420336 RepID=UPI0027380A83|nr:type IA DNA topoisomerase [Candidatus Epulopiscium viviparus]